MSKTKKHFIYWILPSLVVGICMAIYFFDIFGLSYLIAPEKNREFGIVENIQLLIIIAIIIMAFKKLWQSKTTLVRLIFITLIAGSIFIFLEEIDYGLHYYDYLPESAKELFRNRVENNHPIRNVHNQGSNTEYMKLFAYLSFGIAAITTLVVKRLNIKNKLIYYFAPHQYFIYTLLAMFLLNRAALWMDKYVKVSGIKALNSNVSEFEEVFIYYIVFLYLLEKGNLLLSFDKESLTTKKLAV